MALTKTASQGNTGVTDIFETSEHESYALTINPAAISHIINRLTDVYTKPIVATVRETISNAIDATKILEQSGVTANSVEVTSPSAMSPYFIVRDHGTGMSRDTVDNVFNSYGGSTKTNSFNQIGSHGLGAKAPLAYAQEFEVSTTHEGVTTKFSISRDENGPRATIIGTEHTGESSGTTVKVPVRAHNFHEFYETIDMYRNFFFNDKIIIDGVTCSDNSSYIKAHSIVIESESGTKGDIWVLDSSISHLSEKSTNYRKVFSIGYVLNGFLYAERNYQNPDVIVELKPGVVDFSSSRDEITRNDRYTLLESLVKKAIDEDFIAYRAAVKCVASRSSVDSFKLLNKMFQDPVFCGNKVTFDGIDFTWDIGDFESSDGKNIVQAFKKSKNSIPVMSLHSFGKRKFRRVIMADSINNKVFQDVSAVAGSEAHSVAEHQNSVASAFSKSQNDMSYLSAARYICKDNNGRYNNQKVFFVSVDSEKEVRRILRLRTSIHQISRNDTFVIAFVKGTHNYTKVDQEIINELLGEENVSFETFDSFQKIATDHRTSVVRRSSSVDTVYATNITSEGFKDREELVAKSDSIAYNRQMVTANIEDIKNENSLVVYIRGVFYSNSSIVPKILNGYMDRHGEHSLADRKIFVVSNPAKSVMDAIGYGDHIAMSPSFYHASKAVNEATEGYRYSRSVEEDKISYADTDAIVSTFIRGNASLFSTSVENAKNIAEKGVKSSFLDDIVGVFETYGKMTSYSPVPIKKEDVVGRVGIDEFNRINSIIKMSKVVLEVTKYWNSDYVALSSSMRILNSNDNEIPEYLKDSAVRYISETLDKMYLESKNSENQ